MEEMELPVGLELQLSSQQSVLYYTYDSEERFLDKVETCQYLRPCKRAAGESGAAAARTGGSVSAKAADASAAREAASGRMGASGTSSAAGNTSGPSSVGTSRNSAAGAKLAPNKIALVAGACIAVLVIFFLVNPGKKKNTEPENAVTATTVQDDTGSDTQNDTGTQADDNTAQNGADTTTNTVDEPTADTTAATWDYTITRSEESTTYSFDRGPRIVMPASWGSQVTVRLQSLSFFHGPWQDIGRLLLPYVPH